MTQPPPITSAQVPDEWIAAVREAAQLSGWPMRCDAVVPMIEFKDCNRNEWRVKQLPGGGTLFTSTQERDIIARKLEGRP